MFAESTVVDAEKIFESIVLRGLFLFEDAKVLKLELCE